jgi:hypothetical protein
VAYRKSPTVEFDGKPDIDELIRALMELKEDHGGNALVRVRGYLSGFSLDGGGPFLKAITVVPAEPAKEAEPK